MIKSSISTIWDCNWCTQWWKCCKVGGLTGQWSKCISAAGPPPPPRSKNSIVFTWLNGMLTFMRYKCFHLLLVIDFVGHLFCVFIKIIKPSNYVLFQNTLSALLPVCAVSELTGGRMMTLEKDIWSQHQVWGCVGPVGQSIINCNYIFNCMRHNAYVK